MKKLIALLAALSMVAQVQPAHAEDRFELNNTVMPQGSVLMQVAESELTEGFSWMHSDLTDKQGLSREQQREAFKICASLDDPNCNPNNSKRRISATSVFPFCAPGVSEICIEGVSVSVNGQPSVPATFVRMANDGKRLEANSRYKLLEGGSTSLFEYKDPISGVSMNLAATVKVLQQFNFAKKEFEIPFLNASVLPYRVESGGQYVTAGSGASNSCTFVESGVCGVPQTYPDGVAVKLTFNAPSFIGGWFRGRMRNPQIQVTAVNKNVNKISVEAAPIQVPKFGIVKTIDKLEGQEKVWFGTQGGWGIKSGVATGVDASRPEAFKYVEHFRSQANDSITGKSSTWFLTTVNAGSGSGCLADSSKVQGIVTTNSLVYDGSAPTFSGGFLNYKVGGLHFEIDGKTPFQGSYDLVMRSDTARCLYGFSNAPLSATVSVTNDKGSKTTATTVVSEKNGWLKMAAYGFTFSNKTIKVKITKKAVKPKAKPKPAPKKR
jgi:hypothetical protein